MKKSLALLLALALLFTLTACAKTPPATDPVEPEEPVEPTPVPGALCAILDGQRLYAQPLDGSEMYLLVDKYCYAFDRRGTDVIATFDDNTIRHFDLLTGESEVLYTTPEMPYQVWWCDSGFVYEYATMTGTTLYYYNTETATCTQLPQENAYGCHVLGDTLYYRISEYSGDTSREWLAAFDLSAQQKTWRLEIPVSASAYLMDDTLYLAIADWTSGAGTGDQWCAVDPATGTLSEPIEFPFDIRGYRIDRITPDGYLVMDRETMYMCFFTPEGEKHRVFSIVGNDLYSYVQDGQGDLLLLSHESYDMKMVLDEGVYYNNRQLFLYDMTTGELTDLSYIPESGKLFQDGDFPVLDSSTARKPITRAIYSLFCLESGVGGAQPVCNTTHGAWLAIADKTSDIALLAAPTAEEEAYLKEKGVEVEMKLYGGDGLVFIANKASGVENLTLEQVRGIYRGEITNWSQVGGVDAPITIYIRDEQSGSQRLFERMVWGDDADMDMDDFLALGFQPIGEMSTIVGEVVADPYAIGYSIMTYLRDVFEEPDLVTLSLEGAAPTPENVANGSYPMGTKGYVVIRSDEPEDSPARRLYNWFGSPMSDQILTQNGVTPLSE